MLTPAFQLGAATLLLLSAGARTLDGQAIGTHPRVKEALAAYEKWLDGERAFKKIPGDRKSVV